MIRKLALTACLVASLVTTGMAAAQEAPQQKGPQSEKEKAAPKAKTPAPPAAGPAQPTPGAPSPAQTIPEPEALLILIRTTLIALNQANQTGNYTVLHDLGAPTFQAGNSAAQLGIGFANLRNQNFDISPVAVVTPQVTEAPQITAQGLLRILGFFPTQPFQIKFEMLFQQVSGAWRLFGMSVSAVPAESGARDASNPAATPSKK